VPNSESCGSQRITDFPSFGGRLWLQGSAFSIWAGSWSSKCSRHSSVRESRKSRASVLQR
jgi:hypothetical protein